MLKALVSHAARPEADGHTLSDFALSPLSQAEIEMPEDEW